MNKITRKSFLKVFAATMVGGAAASALTGATAPVSIDETNGKVSRWVKNNLNPDGPLTIAKQGMFSSGGTVTAPVAGTYDATTNWLDTTRAGNTAHVDHANFSATGTTQGVAQAIADTVGADLFEVVPSDPYTSDDLTWTNNDSRVSREHNDEGLRAVALESTDVDGWDDYDTVFIGYPIWWGIAAWPMSSFVAVNDFTGKTVIPFCTSTSSGIGQSGELLAELADAGTWLDGQRFSRGSSEADIASWVNGLNL